MQNFTARKVLFCAISFTTMPPTWTKTSSVLRHPFLSTDSISTIQRMLLGLHSSVLTRKSNSLTARNQRMVIKSLVKLSLPIIRAIVYWPLRLEEPMKKIRRANISVECYETWRELILPHSFLYMKTTVTCWSIKLAGVKESMQKKRKMYGLQICEFRRLCDIAKSEHVKSQLVEQLNSSNGQAYQIKTHRMDKLVESQLIEPNLTLRFQPPLACFPLIYRSS